MCLSAENMLVFIKTVNLAPKRMAGAKQECKEYETDLAFAMFGFLQTS